MKIQCDVCEKEEALFFCSADEAALCSSCDHLVHHANIFATKHLRFSLHHPPASASQPQPCDVCQERRALLFCREDRAMLCRACDLQMHKVNEHTQKHNRFLLTGVLLSSNASASASTPNLACSPSSGSASTPSFASDVVCSTTVGSGSATSDQMFRVDDDNVNSRSRMSQEGSVSAESNVPSQYLLETLPSWQIQDFLDFI